MITVTETSTRTISTPEEIAAFLQSCYDQAVASTPFAAGEMVIIARRDGITPEVGAGGVAIFLLAMPESPFSHVLLLTADGLRIVTQVPTGNLAKRTLPDHPTSDTETE